PSRPISSPWKVGLLPSASGAASRVRWRGHRRHEQGHPHAGGRWHPHDASSPGRDVSATFTESVVEDAALAWLDALGYALLHGPNIAAGEVGAERRDAGYRDVVLERRLREALARLNSELPPEALEDAARKLTRVDAPSVIERNRAAHRMLVDGI